MVVVVTVVVVVMKLFEKIKQTHLNKKYELS